ncbi:MAG: DUF1573 domain-containing protein [Bacteroidales bacterium]|nr:DUF1573 domain-containing protein [Bacteroidales bacterium]MDY0196323.1 DUF1573 domain-containing protein [Tenuifilaceae bacterium]
MRRFMLYAFLMASSVVLFAQQPADEELKKKGPYIRFEPSEINLGNISTNDVTEDIGNIEIEFYNDGVQPLILNQVTGCCGTRINDWTRKPIAPGQKGTIKVWFRVSPQPHRISRTITVQSNAINGNNKKMAILGEVVIPSSANEIQLP